MRRKVCYCAECMKTHRVLECPDVGESAAGVGFAAELACYVADLEECLAGFIAIAGTNGAYLSEEMVRWSKNKLEGKEDTPLKIFLRILVAT